MLKLITLHTIDCIFAHAHAPVGAGAKMLYINCITHHFKPLPPTASNMVAFEIPISEIPNYHRYELLFEELNRAGLVELRTYTVFFINLWGCHIDKSSLQKQPFDFMGDLGVADKDALEKEFMENDYLFELVAMKHKIDRQHYAKLVQVFVTEQVALNKKYYNLNDCFKHFLFWTPTNLPRTIVEKKQSRLLGE